MGKTAKALDSWHDAYIRIAISRQQDRPLIALISGNIISKKFITRMILFMQILLRNVISRVRGRFAKQICGFSRQDFEEFISSF
jgi:hypothetical protein